MQTGKMKLTNFAGVAQPEDEAGQNAGGHLEQGEGDGEGGAVPSIYV